ncbi:hypothetical protein LC593_15060 [Nostoc sp. CHAB 5844]|nr:hypothetical protein [Nostoc sp. CHAB 5844]
MAKKATAEEFVVGVAMLLLVQATDIVMTDVTPRPMVVSNLVLHDKEEPVRCAGSPRCSNWRDADLREW